MNVSIHTLGCKVNQVESQAMAQLLLDRGHRLAGPGERADACIINSCAVTAQSGQKSRQALRQARRRHPGAIVALAGCYPQVSGEEARRLGADLLGGSGGRAAFLDALEAVWQDRQARVTLDAAEERTRFEFLPGGGPSARTRAFLKVEDGCENHCTYCIIPRARGPVRSLPLEAAVSEAKRLAAEGVRELVLTGIELSSWGQSLSGRQDLPETKGLTDLIEAVCRAVPGCRVRLGSLEPRTVTEDFCRRLAALENLCPHVHLSLQSGCDDTLRRMGRRYDTARYAASVALLRQHFRPLGLTTDLIVGFPGETEEDFSESLAFLQRMAFSGVHVFPYSRREGTPAASMDGQLSKGEKASRAAQAGVLAAALEAKWHESLLGQTRPVLFEEEREGLWQGHTPEYALVRAKGTDVRNEIRSVLLTEAGDGVLFGTIIEEEAP